VTGPNSLTQDKVINDTRLTAIFQVIQVIQYRRSPFWMLLELQMIEVVVATGAVRRAKLQ